MSHIGMKLQTLLSPWFWAREIIKRIQYETVRTINPPPEIPSILSETKIVEAIMQLTIVSWLTETTIRSIDVKHYSRMMH